MQVAGTADAVRNLRTDELTNVSLRSAFAGYADTHSAASVRRCWSTWNTLCTFPLTAELVQANPMPLIGRPKVPKTLPKSYPARAVTDLVAVIDADQGSTLFMAVNLCGDVVHGLVDAARWTEGLVALLDADGPHVFGPFIYVLEELTVDRLQVNEILGSVTQ